MASYGEQQEEKLAFRQRQTTEDKAKHMFNALGSAGANDEKLARLLTAFDFAMSLLGWDDVKLTNIITHYQASIDSKYHDDYKSVATIEELDSRLAKRRTFGKSEPQSLI